ncbi:GL20923 [Drosophila persimilis]|uniref:GL20923 n=1 Tax=Drosophila persimilis TaxID=7234 RepID=B4H951_DROPE|nr:GL20923 [Drosophila persimilis]
MTLKSSHRVCSCDANTTCGALWRSCGPLLLRPPRSNNPTTEQTTLDTDLPTAMKNLRCFAEWASKNHS